MGFISKRGGAWRCVGIAIMAAVLTLAVSHPADAAVHKKPRHHARHSTRYVRRQPVDRYASIVIDTASNQVLSEKNADKKLYPASLTKMLTLYLTFEAIENGTLRKNDRIPVSAHAANQEPSSLGLEAGTMIRVEDAIYGIVTKSANDAATALGEYLGDGSEVRFAQRMNAKARALGMNDSHFVNASGLFDPMQYATARDMASLARALVYDYPKEYRYFSTPSFTWAGQVMENHNRLMQSYDGMDGIKTGYVHQSGFNLVASAVQNGHRLVGVIFGGRTTASRNAEMARLLDRGFADVKNPRLAAAPKFGTMGLALKNGKAAQEEEGDADVQNGTRIAQQFRPKPISTKTIGTYSAGNDDKDETADAWAVQIGSFNTKVSGLQALKHAQGRLSTLKGADGTVPIVVPLATNRGTIYRARLSGFDKEAAENACRILKGNCLILALQ
jgi:D-alanyl-D-alanine carboxypeptidase